MVIYLYYMKKKVSVPSTKVVFIRFLQFLSGYPCPRMSTTCDPRPSTHGSFYQRGSAPTSLSIASPPWLAFSVALARILATALIIAESHPRSLPTSGLRLPSPQSSPPWPPPAPTRHAASNFPKAALSPEERCGSSLQPYQNRARCRVPVPVLERRNI
jgi:hypothetical protein